MYIEIRNIDRKDEKYAMKFAIEGMHLDRYEKNKVLLRLYARYFWYLEMNRATQCIAAYVNGKLEGILLADIKGETHPFQKGIRKVYIFVMQWILNHLFKDSSGTYDKVNAELFRRYSDIYKPDGELIFLAADPVKKIRGIGTKMLKELERREKGKLIYLYTDDACTWQFYEHRGFQRVGEKKAVMDFGKESVPILCLLYSKRLGTNGIE